MVIAGTIAESFPKAHDYLLQLADLEISDQRIRRATRRIGAQRLILQQRLTECFFAMPIPHQLHRVPDGVEAPEIAAVMADGGRMQIFDRSHCHASVSAEAAVGMKRKKGEFWRESRIGLVLSMSGPSCKSDPCPELPAFLAGGAQLEKKLAEIGHVIGLPESATSEASGPAAENEALPPEPVCQAPRRRSRSHPLLPEDRPLPGPQIKSRDCVASRDCWVDFGRTLAAEAWSRGFAGAIRKVFVSDGSDAIRTLAETHFSDYVMVLDLMHALSYAMSASRGVGGSKQEISARYHGWAELIWRGRVSEVILELDHYQQQIGEPAKDASSEDPREAVRRSRVYYRRQQDRMAYPRYRRAGLPLTSSLMESAVKQVGRRVKGTEKFWSSQGGDALLALRADAISDNDRLVNFLRQFAEPTDGVRDYQTAA